MSKNIHGVKNCNFRDILWCYWFECFPKIMNSIIKLLDDIKVIILLFSK